MGHVGGVDRSVYCASKHAVEGFTKTMAIEWGQHGIRVNTICPTFVRTPLTEATFLDPNRVSWIEEKIKLGRVGQIEDVMGAVVFLASDASASGYRLCADSRRRVDSRVRSKDRKHPGACPGRDPDPWMSNLSV